MQAIILAAGMGKRLKELTDNNTKCMIKVNGITMIERMLMQLDKLRLSRIVLVVGYKGDKLIEFISSLEVKTPLVYVENQDYDKTNNIYSLYLAKEYLRREDTILLESDLIFEDIVLNSVLEDTRPSLALVSKYESWMDGTVVTLREDHSIADFLPKEHFRFADIKNYYKTVNIYKFSQEFSDTHYVPFLEAYSHALGNNVYYEQVLKVINQLDNSELRAKVLEEGNWYEIDDIQDLDIAGSIFNPNETDKLIHFQVRYGGYWRYPNMLDFCYLVNPFFPPQRLLDEIKANFEVLATEYPSGQRVNNLLSAKFFNVGLGRIVTGNGAAELIKSVIATIPGNLGIIVPTFEEYFRQKNSGIIEYKPDNEILTYTASDLINYFNDKDIEALVVINPDNPTGNYIPYEGVLTLIKWAEKKRIKLILDESFVDFADINDTLIVDSILKKYPSLIVIKSISKAYGVPGFRLGVLASGDEVFVKNISENLSIWNINSFGEFYLQICEKYKSDFADAMRRFYPVRDKLYDDLEKIPFLEPIPSKANYIMCYVTNDVSSLKLAEFLLAKHNIFIKSISEKIGIDRQSIRVSVKRPEENEELIKAIRLYSEELKVGIL